MEAQEENLPVIQNFPELIEPHMTWDKSRIIRTNYSRLSKPNDENGLSMLKIELELLNSTTGEDWVLSLVAKTIPKQKESKDIVHIEKGFKNEVGIYMFAKPVLEKYIKEKGLKNGADFFVTHFGGRINLNGEDIVDHNAVLVLQNYRNKGFITVSGRTGLDLESSMLFLKSLAKLHGTFFGLKIFKPKEFNDRVKPYLKNHTSIIQSDMENIENIVRRHMVEVLHGKEFDSEVIERAVTIFNRRSGKEFREPWATFVHNNTWVDNILLGFDKHKKPKYIKLLDYTTCEFGSPLKDLLFFLFSSVELGILKLYLDDLIDCYYYCLISILKRLDIEEKELFCRLAFNRELKMAATQSEFYKITCMLYQILGTKPSNTKCDYMGNNIPELQDEVHKRRLCYIVNEFNNRGWLDV